MCVGTPHGYVPAARNEEFLLGTFRRAHPTRLCTPRRSIVALSHGAQRLLIRPGNGDVDGDGAGLHAAFFNGTITDPRPLRALQPYFDQAAAYYACIFLEDGDHSVGAERGRRPGRMKGPWALRVKAPRAFFNYRPLRANVRENEEMKRRL